MRVHEQERAGIDLLTTNLTSLSASASAALSPNADLGITSPLATLYTLLAKVSVMLDSVLEYVRAVAAGEREGDERVGRALLETVGVVPTSNVPTAKGQLGDAKGFEEDFNAHLADVLMVRGLRWCCAGKTWELMRFGRAGFVLGQLGQDPDGDQLSSEPPCVGVDDEVEKCICECVRTAWLQAITGGSAGVGSRAAPLSLTFLLLDVFRSELGKSRLSYSLTTEISLWLWTCGS